MVFMEGIVGSFKGVLRSLGQAFNLLASWFGLLEL